MSNAHIATAKFRQEGVHEWQSREGDTDATNLAAAMDAQTEATLALAYEQRTANLIALWSNPQASSMSGKVTWGIGNDHIGHLLQEIQQRLGVEL